MALTSAPALLSKDRLRVRGGGLRCVHARPPGVPQTQFNWTDGPVRTDSATPLPGPYSRCSCDTIDECRGLAERRRQQAVLHVATVLR